MEKKNKVRTCGNCVHLVRRIGETTIIIEFINV